VAGRAAVRRRRAGAIAAVAVAVAMTATGAYAVLPADRAAPPVPPAETTHPIPGVTLSPSPEPVGPSIGAYGLSGYAGNVVVPPHGEPVTLPFPTDQVFSVSRVPFGEPGSGCLGGGDPDGLWWVPDAGEPRRIGGLSAPVFAADGSMLVASAPDAPGTMVAVALPSLAERGRTRFDAGFGPLAVGVAGDLVLLRGVQGGPGSSGTAVWDLATGSLTPTGQENVWAWDVAADGSVLRRVDEYGAGPKDIVSACVDAVPLSVPLPVGGTGLCGQEAMAMHGGELSASGEWVYLYSGDPDTFPGHLLLPASDLRAGRWDPVELDPAVGKPCCGTPAPASSPVTCSAATTAATRPVRANGSPSPPGSRRPRSSRRTGADTALPGQAPAGSPATRPAGAATWATGRQGR
jgi:hypothetical protein